MKITMARTIAEIQQEMLDAKALQSSLDGLTSTSQTSIWRLFIYIVATAVWTHEKLWDLFKADIDETIAALKPHSLRWYAEKAKQFQYGYDLVDEADYYDNSGEDEQLVEASKVVDYAAVVEQTRGLRIKVAKDDGADLVPLTNDELDAFIYYMKQIKDAGVRLNITTGVADNLKAALTVVYNPLVLNAEGGRIDGTDLTPVQNAIKNYLKNLPFNGILSLQKLIDQIQAVEGVEDLKLTSARARYGLLPFTTINITYQPDSGYLRIEDADLTIQFVANE